jgi:hypothetical protein
MSERCVMDTDKEIPLNILPSCYTSVNIVSRLGVTDGVIKVRYPVRIRNTSSPTMVHNRGTVFSARSMPSCYKQDKLRVESLAAVNEKGRRLV